MTPKEYLQQYRHAVERARSALEHLQELQTMATRTTPIYGGEGCGSHQSGDEKLVDAVSKIIEAKNRVSDELEMLEATEHQVIETINNVEDSTLSTLLYERYINGKTFEAIAVQMNFCYYHIVHRLHPKALKAVKMLLNVT